MDENLFQWVHFAAHSKFYLTLRKLSSCVKACSIERPRMAEPWAMENLFYIFLRLAK
jgi:hypothetical protein